MPETAAVEAGAELGHLLDRVELGEQIAITRYGREVARLVPADDPAGISPAEDQSARRPANSSQRLGKLSESEKERAYNEAILTVARDRRDRHGRARAEAEPAIR